MPSGKEYQMLFKLNAQANSGFKGTFSQAQAEFARLGNEIQSLNRVQGDITAYQKQAAAVDSTRARLENLTRQHELLSQQIQNTAGDTSGLQMEQLKLEQRMASAQGALERQEGRLSSTSQRLVEAGVSTADLAGESARLTTQIEELSKEQEQAAQSAQEYGDSAANAFQAAGEALAAAGIVAGIKEIGAAYIGTVQAAGEFGATMSNVEALSGASASQMAALTAQAKELGATTKFTANESGEAMGYMGMASWNAQQMLAGMPGVLDLAAASGEDLAGVADIVTDALTGFGLTAADTGQFVDVLATASTKSNTNVGLLGESFKYVAPLCGTLGYSAEDAAVSLGLMANAGIKGSEADYQSLTQSIYSSAGAAERMANIKLDDLAGDLTLLRSAADGLSLSSGEQFMPQARGLVQIGTGIITFTNELIDQHPVLTKVVLGAAGAVGVLTGDSQEAAGAVDDITASVLAMSDSLRDDAVAGLLDVGTQLGAAAGEISQIYREAYTEAYESISGQLGLFEQMSVEVGASVGDMIASLESQAAYMASYSENLRAAAEMGLSEGLIAQLSDGSTESAAYLQEIVNNGQGKIDELNAAFAKVQEGKDEFSSTVAEMQIDLQSTMDEAARTVDSTVQEMDMYREAAQAARSTFQGFIDGANNMSASVQAAYRSVAVGAMSAIQGAMGVGLSVSRGYATGTTDAEPGFAMVGEHGPELVFFQGGEQVVNVTQTAAMQRQTALSAAPAGSYGGGEPVVVQIYFQFEGNATPEAVARLREYGSEFEDRVRQVMEEYAMESARRTY